MKTGKRKNRMWIYFGITVAVFFSLEIYLRYYWGFCDSVLMMENKNYEYIAQPNQDRYRFRNRISFNRYSMRSEEPDTTAYKILGFGDSIINGGVMVDQDSLATTLLGLKLSENSVQKVQVLNIGAGSWGPDNAFAYLSEKGNFDAKIIFLVVSSHDAFDNMDFVPVIDKVQRYESRQYVFATWELVDKYLMPRIKGKGVTEDQGIFKKGEIFNTGFLNLFNYCNTRGIPFFIYLNPDQYELKGQTYNREGQLIIQFCEKHQIPLIKGMANTSMSDYRGIVHMNDQGQRHMSEAILPTLEHFVKKSDNYER